MSNDFNIMFCESNTFTSSSGGLGFTSSIKKTQNFDFTPSPKSDNLCFEEHHNKHFFELDTHENTPLEGVFNLENLDLDKGRSYSQKFEEELIANYSKEKSQIYINSSKKTPKYLSSKITNTEEKGNSLNFFKKIINFQIFKKLNKLLIK